MKNPTSATDLVVEGSNENDIPEAISALIRDKGNLECRNETGMTPLICAERFGSPEATSILIEAAKKI